MSVGYLLGNRLYRRVVVLCSLLAVCGCGASDGGSGAVIDPLTGKTVSAEDGGGSSVTAPAGEFVSVDTLEEVGSQAKSSPFDAITKPDIPFELKRNDLPKEAIGFLPVMGLVGEAPREPRYVFGRGKYISVAGKGEDIFLLDTDSKNILPSPFNVLPGGISDDAKYVVTSKGVVLGEDLKRDSLADPFLSFFHEPKAQALRPSLPTEAEFSKDGKYVAVGFDGPSSAPGICLIDLRLRKITQVIETGCMPIRFSNDSEYFRCFSQDGCLLTYQRDGLNGYKGIARSGAIFPAEDQWLTFTSSCALGEDFLVTVVPDLSDDAGDTFVTLFQLEGVEITQVAQEIYTMSVTKLCATEGSRFAVFGFEPIGYPNAGARWLLYGDSKTKKVAFLAIPQYLSLADLDRSGRYALFTGIQGNKQLAILRLAND